MKKFILWILILSFASVTNAAYLANNITVKLTSSVSYTDEITVQDTGTEFDLKFNVIPNDEPTRNFELIVSSLPAGLTYKSSNIESDSCSPNISGFQTTNSLVKYTFNPNGTPCTAVVKVTFETNGLSVWSHNINYIIKDSLDDSIQTSTNSVKINVESDIVITKATTIDTDTDWYIDAFDLTFNQSITWKNLASNQVEIEIDNSRSQTTTSFSETTSTTWRLSFTDWMFTSWELPSIEILNTTNGYIAKKYGAWVIQDGAAPQVTKINWVAYTGQTPTVTNGSSSVSLTFSEPINPEWFNTDASIRLGTTNVWSSESISSSKTLVTFSPSSTLWQNSTYNVFVGDNTKDIAGNVFTKTSYNFYVPSSDTGGSSGGGGWGWWWGGWGWWSSKDYEEYKFLSKISTDSSNLTTWTNKVFWSIDMTSTSPVITSSDNNIEFKANKYAKSLVFIPENTSISSSDKSLTWPYSIEDYSELWEFDLNGKIIPASKTGWVMLFGNKSWATFSNDLEFKMKAAKISSTSRYIVFNSNSLNWPWTQINSEWIKWDADKAINFEYNKGWYFIFVKDIYFGWSSNNITSSNIEEKLAGLTNSKVKKISTIFYNKVWFDEIEYFINIDPELRNEYNSNATNLYAMFKALDDYMRTKDSKYKTAFMNAYKEVKPSLEQYKNIESRYITIQNGVAKPLDQNLAKAFVKIEKVVVGKFKDLKENENISDTAYQKAINWYNDFVLHFSLYKLYKSNEAKAKAKEALKSFYNIYKMKVVKKVIVPQITTYGDVYTFNRNLNFGDIWDDVRDLQKILTAEWYFNYNTTGYFWNVTRNALINFSINELWVDTGWSFNSVIRKLISEREYKK